MMTLTRRGLMAALLAGPAQGHGLISLEETSAATLEGALPHLVPATVAHVVVTPEDSAERMEAAKAALFDGTGPNLLVFWNAHLYDAAQRAAVMTAAAFLPDHAMVLVHAQDTLDAGLDQALENAHATHARFDLVPTPVLFRAEKKGDFKGHLTAVFPTIPGTNDPYSFTVYAHVGQHSTGSHGWYVETRAATTDEYADLAAELERIGYMIEIRARWSQSFDQERRKALRAFDTTLAD